MNVEKPEFDTFVGEMVTFKSDVGIALGTLIQQVGETNARLDETNRQLKEFVGEMRGFRSDVNTRLDSLDEFRGDVNERLDTLVQQGNRTNERLDVLDEFHSDVNERLGGISNFLLDQRIARQQLDDRLTRLEGRVDRLEDKGSEPAA